MEFEEAKLRIKESTDLVEFVQGFVPLKRRGRNFIACCPFHAEKTPSFTVHPESQYFKCYGCGKAGDVFTFVMEREGVSFRDAMEQLAELAGVSLDGVFGRGERSDRPKVDVPEILGKVAAFFAHWLREQDGRAGRDYLASRDLIESAEDFSLGMHPFVPGVLRKFADSRKLPRDVLAQAGLLSEDGRREPFLGRVMFPIQDERGRVVGFGGRVLPGEADDRRPKYVNSPESPWFNKRRLLYGLRQVKDAGTRRVVVVEGYTDVIACHRAGLTGTVATLGTSLTVEHAKMLERYAHEGVVLLFDGDRAGRQAAERAFRELVHSPVAVKLALLPDGSDPADLCADGGDKLEAVVDTAEDALTMWFRLLRQRLDLTVDVDVERAAGECGQILGDVENSARRQALQRNMARHLGLSEDALEPRRLRRRPAAAAAEAEATAPPEYHPELDETRPDPQTARMREPEFDLIAALFVAPSLLDDDRFEQLFTGPHLTPRLDETIRWIDTARVDGVSGVAELGQALFSAAAGDPQLQRFLAESLDRAKRVREPESILLMLRQGRQLHFAREEARQTRVRLQQALADGDTALADQLTEHYTALLRRTAEARESSS